MTVNELTSIGVVSMVRLTLPVGVLGREESPYAEIYNDCCPESRSLLGREMETYTDFERCGIAAASHSAVERWIDEDARDAHLEQVTQRLRSCEALVDAFRSAGYTTGSRIEVFATEVEWQTHLAGGRAGLLLEQVHDEVDGDDRRPTTAVLALAVAQTQASTDKKIQSLRARVDQTVQSLGLAAALIGVVLALQRPKGDRAFLIADTIVVVVFSALLVASAFLLRYREMASNVHPSSLKTFYAAGSTRWVTARALEDLLLARAMTDRRTRRLNSWIDRLRLALLVVAIAVLGLAMANLWVNSDDPSPVSGPTATTTSSAPTPTPTRTTQTLIP